MAADLLTHLLPSLLLAAAEPAQAVGEHAAALPADEGPAPGELFALLRYSVELGLITISIGMLLCLLRIWRGPTLADRVLASDTFGLHVVGLVVLLTIYLGDLTFFDAVLGVAIIGFASTVGFAQFIGAGGDEQTSCVPGAHRGPPRPTAPAPEPLP